jgi:hypothetical protein
MASLIQNISETGHGQNRLAAAINKNMLVLRQISAKTTQSTAQTSLAISRLSELASQLRQSVRGFRLPDNHAATGILSQTHVNASIAMEQAKANSPAAAPLKAASPPPKPVSSPTAAPAGVSQAELERQRQSG